MRCIKWLARCGRSLRDVLTGRSSLREETEAFVAVLEARRASHEQALRELKAQIAELELPPPAPLRQPTIVAAANVRRQAERVLEGELPDRRLGPGRRASDYR